MCLPTKLLDTKGQATIEAAFVLPILMILFLLMLQPGIILYDRIVMKSAAAEGARLLSTTSISAEQTCRDFVLRKLSSIPQLDIFHVHSSGCSYEVNLVGNESSESVAVEVKSKLKPLPLLDFAFALAGMTDGNGAITVSVSSMAHTQPQWVASSADGRDPSRWSQ